MKARFNVYGTLLAAIIGFIAWYHVWQLHQNELTFRQLQDTETFDKIRFETGESYLIVENFRLDGKEILATSFTGSNSDNFVTPNQLDLDEETRSNDFQIMRQMDADALKDDHQRVEDYRRDHGF